MLLGRRALKRKSIPTHLPWNASTRPEQHRNSMLLSPAKQWMLSPTMERHISNHDDNIFSQSSAGSMTNFSPALPRFIADQSLYSRSASDAPIRQPDSIVMKDIVLLPKTTAALAPAIWTPESYNAQSQYSQYYAPYYFQNMDQIGESSDPRFSNSMYYHYNDPNHHFHLERQGTTPSIPIRSKSLLRPISV
jgi:hypothetical protein